MTSNSRIAATGGRDVSPASHKLHGARGTGAATGIGHRGRRIAVRLLTLLALLAGPLSLAGCRPYPFAPASHSPAPAAPSGALVVGQGPGHYTVEQYPSTRSCHYRWTGAGDPLPDRHCTPGASNPKVTQTTLATTICRAGYTTSIRPGTAITGREKQSSALSYGYAGALGAAEFDHLISLELGGSPNDPRNLWTEPQSRGFTASGFTLNPKDRVEHTLRRAVCAHRISLIVAQSAIASNWTTALAVVHVP